MGNVWTEHQDEDGTPYYYNSVTKQGVWEKPDGFQVKKQPSLTEGILLFAQYLLEQAAEKQSAIAAQKQPAKAELDVKARRRTTSAITLKELCSQLAERKENQNHADPAAEKTSPVVQPPGKSAGEKKQPPLVVKNTNFARLALLMSACAAQPTCELTRSGIKVLCFSRNDFDTVQAHLQKHKVVFYTHGRGCERPHKVVIRGLPNLKADFIQNLLRKDHQLDVLAVHTIKRKQQLPAVEETPFIVLFPMGHTSLEELRDKAKKIGPIVIRWEAYRSKQPHVTQCKNSTVKCEAKETQAKRPAWEMDLPPLPDAVPDKPKKQSQSEADAGNNQESTGPSAGVSPKNAGNPKKEGEEELWRMLFGKM